MKRIALSEHFGYRKLIRFTLPSVIMVVFTSVYGVVDGIFVSNIVGDTPFAAVNLIMPYLMAFSAIGFMVGTGGSALISKKMGEGDLKKANEIFSMLVYALVIFGVLCTVVGLLLLRPVAILFGAKGELLEYCVEYGRIILISLTPFMLQNAFQSLLITAEKSSFVMLITILAGMTNIALDALFMLVFDLGVTGAAVATSLSQCVGGLVPLFYFIFSGRCILRLGRTSVDLRALGKVCVNGSSELMSNLSASFVNILYNYQLMRLVGQDGVSAYGVIMYVNFIFAAVFLGYSMGSAPVVSFHYGARDSAEVKGLLKKSLILVGIASVLLTGTAELFARPLAGLFVGYDLELCEMTVNGFMIYSLSFLLCGWNIFGSAFFTALNNGGISALISFARTLVFQTAAVLIVPTILGLNGIWAAVLFAEGFTLILTVGCFVGCRKKYGYV